MIGFLYGQSEYNLLSNAIHLCDYVRLSKEFGYSAISITDPNLYGHKKFIKLCQQYDIKPIVGLEINIDNTYILAYPYNNEGYKNLINISSNIKINNIDINYIKDHSEGIYFITATNDIKIYESYKNILKNVYIGIFNKDIYKEIYQYAIDRNILVLPLSKNLYLKGEKDVYEVLSNIGGITPLLGENHLKSPLEIEEDFKFYNKVFDNLDIFINSLNLDYTIPKLSIPKFKTPNNVSSFKYLKELATLGLNKRLKDYTDDKSVYFNRLDYELNVINDMGYNDYILIVWDFIRYAKKNNILVGPGRGSGAGSLVNYAIGITSVDPLKYNLLFERFLNKERISMPDIDTDFPDDKRSEVIEYVKNLYGKNHVCSISTFGTFQAKSSIRDVAKVLKFSKNELDNVISLFKNNDIDEILAHLSVEDKNYKLLSISKKLENLPRHVSTHAAGIILSDLDLFNIVPLDRGINDMYQSELEASDLEEMGLLKIDFLGLRNLNIIDNVIKQIPDLNNINIYNIPLNSKRVYETLSKGDTLGVFQLESKGIKDFIVKLKPNRFEDLVALLALYRPGPMDNIDEYIRRKNGEQFSYIHPDLKPILEETYGIIVYQEQIMQIALKFAGYTLSEADILRRGVSKKKEEVLISERKRFVFASKKMGYSLEVADKIYDDIVKFASYGFNKSHSVSYAILSYIMAYLKVNYPKQFIAAILNNAIGDSALTSTYLNYARAEKIKIENPDINISEDKYILKDNKIYMPFTCIKGIGGVLSRQIIAQRNEGIFRSFDDFKNSVKIPEEQTKALIYACVFDCFSQSKKSMIETSSEKGISMNRFLEDRLIQTNEFSRSILRKKECEYLGFNLKYNIYKDIYAYAKKEHLYLIKDLKDGFNNVKIVAYFTDFRQICSKKGNLMALCSINDGAYSIPAVIFSKNLKENIKTNDLYLISGNVGFNAKKNKIELVVETYKNLGEF